MPRFRAPDALALLRGLGHDAPFKVVSGKIGEDATVGVMKAGANDYLTKENMARLCPAIERELKEAESAGSGHGPRRRSPGARSGSGASSSRPQTRCSCTISGAASWTSTAGRASL
jgi:DNA-binding NtrC family response regulator